MPPYSYVALEKNNIRLLHVEPGASNEALQAKLVHVPLADSRRSFEALSYAWESDKKMRLMQTPDGRISLTRSLDQALKRLRLPDRKDDVEKSSQVGLMGKIYGAASRTVIYLGLEADNSTSALEMLVKIGQMDFKTKDFSRFPGDVVLEAAGLPDSGDQVWSALRKLWCRPWFRRVWVIQEFVRGYASIVVCGDWEGDWTLLWQSVYRYVGFGLVYRGVTVGAENPHLLLAVAGCRAMHLMIWLKKRTEGYMSTQYLVLRKKPSIPTVFVEADPYNLHHLDPKFATALDGSLDEISQDDEEGREVMSKFIKPAWESEHNSGNSLGIRSFSILDLVTMFKSFLATDERDRFFAPLGLSSEADDEEFAPNYGESLEKVIYRYTLALIERGHCMDLLPYAGFGRLPAGYPSWIPHVLKPAPDQFEFTPLGTFHLYNTAGESKAKVKLCKTSDELTIRGAVVDRLKLVGMNPSELATGTYHGPANQSFWLGCALGTLIRVTIYPTGEPMEEVMWRTFIANRTEMMTEAPLSLGDDFRKWKEYLFGGSWQQHNNVQNPLELCLSLPGYKYMVAFLRTFPFYKLCVTIRGYIGLVPLNAEIGDFVAILNGGNVPFILRSASRDANKARLVGESYIHGFMNGQAMKDKERKEFDMILI